MEDNIRMMKKVIILGGESEALVGFSLYDLRYVRVVWFPFSSIKAEYIYVQYSCSFQACEKGCSKCAQVLGELGSLEVLSS